MQTPLYQLFSALGNALFSSLWQMGLLWLAVAIYCRMRKNLSTNTKTWLHFLALLTGFAAFVITFIISLTTPQTEKGMLQWLIQFDWVAPLLHYGGILYLILLFIPITGIIKSSYKVYQLRYTGIDRVPGTLKLFALDAASHLNISRKVKLYTSKIISSPLTIGFLKPVILLPVAIINQLTPQQLEAIILHELAHIKRNDYLLNFIKEIILTVLYFNPFARMLAGAMELEQEKSADGWVLRFQYGKQMYASALLQLAKNQYTPALAMAAASGKSSQLRNRIGLILGQPAKREKLPGKKLLLLGVLMVFSAGYYFTPGSTPGKGREVSGWNIEKLPLNTDSTTITYAKATIADDKYKIQPIPVTETPEKEQKTNTVYLKIYEDANGKLMAPSKSVSDETEMMPLFAEHVFVAVPKLDNKAEEKIQQSIEAYKQLVAELNWKHIENNLAESVTEAQKHALKQRFNQLLNQVDWEANANLLRSFYKDIDWKKTDAQLKAKFAALIDSRSGRDLKTILKKTTVSKTESESDKIFRDSAVLKHKLEKSFVSEERPMKNDTDSLDNKTIADL